MAKYGDLIRKAREGEDQGGNELDNQLTVKPDNPINDQNLEKPRDSAPGQAINQMAAKSDIQTAKQPEREVNLCVKVPESLRRHWAAEAKRQGITMTEVMTEALTQRFGKPDNQ